MTEDSIVRGPRDTILSSLSDDNEKVVREITIRCYETLCADKDQKQIAEVIFHRLRGRYIKPFLYRDPSYETHYKHGFSMMASACLLIETLESFYQGWEETKTHGSKAFESFFERHSDFTSFRKRDFYKHVRCGILHQGETTGGFKINRCDHTPLFEESTKSINAQKFILALHNALLRYRLQLEKYPWDSECWDNLRRKMRFIIENCTAS